MLRSFAALVVLITLLTASSAVAQSDDAEELLRQGVAQRRAGDDAGALATFQRAYQLAPSGNALGQLGLAEQALGHFRDADEHLRAALATPNAWVERNRPALEEALRTVGAQLASPAPPFASATGSAAPQPAIRHSGRVSPVRAASFAGVAIGGLALVGAAVAWIVRESTVQGYNAHCRGFGDPMPPMGCGEAIAQTSANTAGGVAIANGIVGGLLMAASVIGVVATSRPATERFALACGNGPGDIGIGCVLRF